jgi:hypothetical protein
MHLLGVGDIGALGERDCVVAPSFSAAARISASSREQIATRAPSCTSSRAMAKPRPFEAPVTIALRPWMARSTAASRPGA